jgi:hypothetical protein
MGAGEAMLEDWDSVVSTPDEESVAGHSSLAVKGGDGLVGEGRRWVVVALTVVKTRLQSDSKGGAVI